VGDELHGWRTIVRAAWGASAVAAALTALLPINAVENTFTLVALVGFGAGLAAASFVRSRGLPMRASPRQMTPLTALVALFGGAAIGGCLAGVIAIMVTSDLPEGIGLAAMCVIGGIGSELLVVLLRRVSPPHLAS
jgi:hypothetical protein